jgi:hypothetical protein
LVPQFIASFYLKRLAGASTSSGMLMLAFSHSEGREKDKGHDYTHTDIYD